MTLFEELQWRGLIKDTAGEDLADKLMGAQLHFIGERILLQIVCT